MILSLVPKKWLFGGVALLGVLVYVAWLNIQVSRLSGRANALYAELVDTKISYDLARRAAKTRELVALKHIQVMEEVRKQHEKIRNETKDLEDAPPSPALRGVIDGMRRASEVGSY